MLEGSSSCVTLLAVVEEPVYSAFWSDGLIAPEVLLPPSGELREELDRRAEEMLAESAEPLRAAGLEAQPRIRFGNTAAEILAEAEEGGYDLIIMGSHGRGVLGGFLLGSVSNRVVHHAKCPVLIVRR
jgi:nucleotide-binding universal stress UspA family protein